MPRRLHRLVALSVLALASLLAVGAAASANTVTVSPSGAKTLTATTGTRIVIISGSASTTIICTGATFTATVNSLSGSSWPLQISSDVRPAMTGCRSASLNVDIGCNPNGTWNVSGVTVSGVTPGRIGFNCSVRLASRSSCNVNFLGSVAVSFNNTGSQLTVLTSGQMLLAQNSTCTSTFLNGPSGLSSSSGGNIVYTVTPTTTIIAA